jgi:hypothetical protein
VDNEEIGGQSVLLALVRRWRWLVAGAVAGALLAAVLVLVLPKRYTASGELLLHPVQGDNAEQVSRMQTAAELAHSIPVAERALLQLDRTGDPEKLLEQYGASPLTNELLQLRARAPSAELAVRRVAAVAEAFLDYLADESERELASIERTVEPRMTALQARIDELDVRIAALGATAGELNPEQDALLNQREALTDELATAQSTLDQARADHRLALDRNRLVAEPLLPKRPSSPRWREFLVVGCLLGTVLAVGFVLARDVISQRLFRRSELARAAAASVVASPTLRVRRPIRRRRRKERLAKLVASPSAELASATDTVASVLRSTAGMNSPRFVIVSMAAEAEALVLVLRLAMDLATTIAPTSQRRDARVRSRAAGSGSAARRHGVLVLDVTRGERAVVGPVLRALRIITRAEDDETLDEARVFQVTRASDNALDVQPIGTRPDAAGNAEILLAFAGDWRSAAATAHQLRVVEPEASLIVVRPGTVTAANVQESAAALHQAGAPPLGVVVVDPDRFDTSTGQLHTSAGEEALPVPAVATSASEPERGALRRL